MQGNAPSGWWTNVCELYQKALDYELNGLARGRSRESEYQRSDTRHRADFRSRHAGTKWTGDESGAKQGRQAQIARNNQGNRGQPAARGGRGGGGGGRVGCPQASWCMLCLWRGRTQLPRMSKWQIFGPICSQQEHLNRIAQFSVKGVHALSLSNVQKTE